MKYILILLLFACVGCIDENPLPEKNEVGYMIQQSTKYSEYQHKWEMNTWVRKDGHYLHSISIDEKYVTDSTKAAHIQQAKDYIEKHRVINKDTIIYIK